MARWASTLRPQHVRVESLDIAARTAHTRTIISLPERMPARRAGSMFFLLASISPDCRRILIFTLYDPTGRRTDRPTRGAEALYAANIDGSDLRLVRRIEGKSEKGQALFFPIWSRDGRHFALEINEEHGSRYELFDAEARHIGRIHSEKL